MIDETFVDIWYSVEGEYSFHWEQRGVRDAFYWHDNAPHVKWAAIKTFPKHCHDSIENNVSVSNISDEPEEAIRYFMRIIRKRLLEFKSHKGKKVKTKRTKK